MMYTKLYSKFMLQQFPHKKIQKRKNVLHTLFFDLG